MAPDWPPSGRIGNPLDEAKRPLTLVARIGWIYYGLMVIFVGILTTIAFFIQMTEYAKQHSYWLAAIFVLPVFLGLVVVAAGFKMTLAYVRAPSATKLSHDRLHFTSRQEKK